MKIPTILTTVLLLSSYLLHGQGIKFEEVSFEEAKKIAKESNKNIFIDCYTTWCGPCKQMDREVYVQEEVGTLMNEKFVNIKVQMDSTKNDSKWIKNNYQSSKALADSFQIKAYPSYLFLSPAGELLHKDVGFRKPSDFIEVARVAINPNKNIESNMALFRNGKLNKQQMSDLLVFLYRTNEKKLSFEVAEKYKERYLDKVPVDSILTKENVAFALRFNSTIKSSDNLFKAIYKDPGKYDSLAGRKGLATTMIFSKIAFEEVESRLFNGSTPLVEHPDWKKIKKTITEKYTREIAEKIVAKQQLNWYYKLKDWPNASRHYIEFKEKYGLDTTGTLGKARLNSEIYELIFLHSYDPKVLGKAAQWMQDILTTQPDNHYFLDTYSNLLYKLGRKSEAIEHEQKALATAIAKKDLKSSKEFEKVLEKMKNGVPTW